MDRLVELASRIRKAGLSYSAGGKLYHRYDGRSEESNRMKFDWRNGVLDGAVYPEVVVTPVSEPEPVAKEVAPETYRSVGQVYQSNIPEDASAYSGLQYGALLTGDTLERVSDISIPYAVEGYGKTVELTPEQREIMQAVQKTGYDRAKLESGLLLSPSTQSGVLSDDVVTDSSRSTYLESKLLGESDAEAVRRAVDTLKGSDVDTIKAVQTEMYKKGYYDDLATPKIPVGTKEENMELQRKLKSFGYDLGTYGENKDGVDGKIGKKTQAAWSKYVKEHPDEAVLGSVADGKVGPATRRALAKYYKDAWENPYDPSAFTKVLAKAVIPSPLHTLHDSYLDVRNLQNWKAAVENSQEENMDGIPVVDYSWDVSDDMLTRVAGLLPGGLRANYATSWTSPTVSDGKVGYPDTWDDPDYIEANDNSVLSLLRRFNGIAGAVGTSLSQPGRGTIGNFVYKTTPIGIVISDGYQFKADPSRVIISDRQGAGYNQLRQRMNEKHRAENRRTQTYLIPWDIYNDIHSQND